MNNSSSKQNTPRLLTIPASHYCEKARWALERLNFNYIEEKHVPLFHVFANRKTGAGKVVPVLIVNEQTAIVGAPALLQYLHTQLPKESQLYPNNLELKQEVEKQENLLEKRLGPLVAHWVYYYFLNDKRLIQKLWCEGTPSIEKTMFPVIFPIARNQFKRMLGIKSDSASIIYKQIKQVFKSINQRLADGRTYLMGDTFSSVDLTFSALAGPALLCPDYRGVRLPNLNEIPQEMAQGVKELRAMPAGQYAIKLFRDERGHKSLELTQ